MQWSVPLVVQRREMVYRQGDPGSTVMLVVEGFVKLSTVVDNREVVLGIIGPGGCFGDIAVLNKWPRNADATALSRSRLLAIDGRQFRQALERRPEAMAAAMRLVSERLRAAIERVVDALALSAPARLAKALIQLAGVGASGVQRGDRVRLRLSQSELGSMTGLTRESVNKYLSAWRDAGLIRLAGGSVTLVDPAGLSGLMHGDGPSALESCPTHSARAA